MRREGQIGLAGVITLLLPLCSLGAEGSVGAPLPGADQFIPYVSWPGSPIVVNGVLVPLNVGGVPRHHDLAGIASFINAATGAADVATLLAGDGGGRNGVYSGEQIRSKGIPARVEIVDNKTIVAYRAGDRPVAGRCRSQVSSYPISSRQKVLWQLEFKLGEDESGAGWPVTVRGAHPVLIWELKAPDVQSSLSITVDADATTPGLISLIFGKKAGLATQYSRLSEAKGLRRNQPISVVMEAYMDEREISDGGKGYWRAWVNGNLVVDTYGPTLSAYASEGHQWFLATYLYQDKIPLPDSWVVTWSKARLLESEK